MALELKHEQYERFQKMLEHNNKPGCYTEWHDIQKIIRAIDTGKTYNQIERDLYAGRYIISKVSKVLQQIDIENVSENGFDLEKWRKLHE